MHLGGPTSDLDDLLKLLSPFPKDQKSRGTKNPTTAPLRITGMSALGVLGRS